MAALVVYAAIRSFFLATCKPLWFDEVCTLLVARLPSVSTIWLGLSKGIDSNPPLFYVIERAASRLAQNEQIGFRIPSIVGLCCALVCVFLFVRKRSGPAVALICATPLLLTIFFTTYAAEARPYSLVLAFVAVALVCYQHAPSKAWMLLMAFSLALAPALHYYAIFVLVPFFLAEASLVLQTGRLRVAVWLALGCGCLPFGAFWPLLANLKARYGVHYYASATLRIVIETYGALFSTHGRLGAAAVAALALGLASLTVPLVRLGRDDRTASTLVAERILVLGLLGLPFGVFVAMRITHGGMIPKYSLSTILGIPLVMGFLLPRLGRRAIVLVSSFIVLVLAFQEMTFWSSRHNPVPNGAAAAIQVESLIESAGHPDLPVLTSDAIDYLQLEHYVSPEWKKRLFAGDDPAAAVVYAGTDTSDMQLLILRLFEPLQVPDFNVFVSSHPEFLLYSADGGQSDWWPARLIREGYSLQVLGVDGERRVYLVSSKAKQP